jgi:hypothetical protein
MKALLPTMPLCRRGWVVLDDLALIDDINLNSKFILKELGEGIDVFVSS